MRRYAGGVRLAASGRLRGTHLLYAVANAARGPSRSRLRSRTTRTVGPTEFLSLLNHRLSSRRGWNFWRGDYSRRDHAAAECKKPEHDFFHCASPLLGSKETLTALQNEDQKLILELNIRFTGAHLWAAVHDARNKSTKNQLYFDCRRGARSFASKSNWSRSLSCTRYRKNISWRHQKRPGGKAPGLEIEFSGLPLAAVTPHATPESGAAPTPTIGTQMANAVAAAVSIAIAPSWSTIETRATVPTVPAVVVGFLDHGLSARRPRRESWLRQRRRRDQGAAYCNKSEHDFSHWVSPLLRNKETSNGKIRRICALTRMYLS